MNPWFQQLFIVSVGLALVVLAAGLWLRVWRRQPLDSYRLAVVVLFVSLSMPLAQWAVQRSELLEGSPLVARISSIAAGLATQWNEAEPAPAFAASSAFGELTLHAMDESIAEDAVYGVVLVPELAASAGQPSDPRGHLTWIGEETGVPLGAVETAGAGDPWWVGGIRYALWAYALGLILSLGRTALRLVRTWGLLRFAAAVTDARTLDVWESLLKDSPLRGRVRLRMTPEIRVPMCFGLGTPTVLIPAEDDSQLSSELLACVLLHELVHLERGDTWVMLGQEFARSLFWFHPAAWWLCNRIDLLRELSCDLLVVRRTGRRKRYATALVEYAAHVRNELGLSRAQATVLLPWSSSNNQLSRRIEMLVNQSTSSGPRRVAFLAVGSLFSLLFAGQLAVAAAMTPAQEVVLHELADADDDQGLAEIIELLSDEGGVELGTGASVITLRELGLDGADSDGAMVWVSQSDDDDPPMIGIKISSTDGGRLVIEEVIDGSLAEKAGLEDDDVIVHINGEDASWEKLIEAKQELKDGKIKLHVLRDGNVIKIKLSGKDLGDKAAGLLRKVKKHSKDSHFPQGIHLFGEDDHAGNLYFAGDDDEGHGVHVLLDKLHGNLKLHGIGKDKIKVLLDKLHREQDGEDIHVITKKLIEKLGGEHGEAGFLREMLDYNHGEQGGRLHEFLEGGHGDGDNNVFFVSPDGERGHGSSFFYSTGADGEWSDDGHDAFTYKLERLHSSDGEAKGDLHFDSSIHGHPKLEIKASLKDAAEALKRAMKEHPEHAGAIKKALESLKGGEHGFKLRTEFPKGNLRFRGHGEREEHGAHERRAPRDRSFFDIRHEVRSGGNVRKEGGSEMNRELEKMRALIRERQEELERLERRLEELNSRTRSRGHGPSRDHAALYPAQAPAPAAVSYAPLARSPFVSYRALPSAAPAPKR